LMLNPGHCMAFRKDAAKITPERNLPRHVGRKTSGPAQFPPVPAPIFFHRNAP
jgi:hypothetical protein